MKRGENRKREEIGEEDEGRGGRGEVERETDITEGVSESVSHHVSIAGTQSLTAALVLSLFFVDPI